MQRRRGYCKNKENSNPAILKCFSRTSKTDIPQVLTGLGVAYVNKLICVQYVVHVVHVRAVHTNKQYDALLIV